MLYVTQVLGVVTFDITNVLAPASFVVTKGEWSVFYGISLSDFPLDLGTRVNGGEW